MEKQIISIIYWGKFLFAFCVVCIHVDFVFYEYIRPICRLAVPFFFMVTGYFLYHNDELTMLKRIRNTRNKYLKLWVQYSILFLAVHLIFLFGVGQKPHFSIDGLISYVLIGGSDDLWIWHNGVQYNIFLITWYLQAGFFALLLFSFLNIKRLLGRNVGGIICLLCILDLAKSTYGIHIPLIDYVGRIVKLSVPFIWLGLIIHKEIDNIERINNIDCIKLILFFVVSLVSSYFEYYMGNPNAELWFSTYPAVASLFCLIIIMHKKSENNRSIIKFGGAFLDKPVKDVFYWHNSVYLLYVLLGISMYRLDAMIVFFTIVMFSLVTGYGITLFKCSVNK